MNKTPLIAGNSQTRQSAAKHLNIDEGSTTIERDPNYYYIDINMD